MAGRPRLVESRRRTRELLAHLASGRSTKESLQLARVKPERFAALLDEDEFWQVYRALREGETEARAA